MLTSYEVMSGLFAGGLALVDTKTLDTAGMDCSPANQRTEQIVRAEHHDQFAATAWPADPNGSSAPRWMQRADGRRCALSYLARRKAGPHCVLAERLPGDRQNVWRPYASDLH